jgi:hypothetical protein
VGSALIGTGQYVGFLLTSFRGGGSSCRGEVGESVVEPAVSAFERFEAALLTLPRFFKVPCRAGGSSGCD